MTSREHKTKQPATSGYYWYRKGTEEPAVVYVDVDTKEVYSFADPEPEELRRAAGEWLGKVEFGGATGEPV